MKINMKNGFVLLMIAMILGGCKPRQSESNDLAVPTTDAPVGAASPSIEETNEGESSDVSTTPTVDPLVGVTIEVHNLVDSDLVSPRMTLRGAYAGLEPDITSIHVLLQPLTAEERLFPAEAYYSVSNREGEWSIPVLFGDDESLAAPVHYRIFLAFTTSEEARSELAAGSRG